MKSIFVYFAVLGITGSMYAHAYDIETHIKMSENAAVQSQLNTYLPSIGFNSLGDQLVDINTSKSIVGWISLGADEEDDTISTNFARYRNHFFDPLTGLGLHALTSGEPSPDWGLEDKGTFLTQNYSFKDGRQAFYDAMTLPSKDNREMWMARTFYIIGHDIHLVQDMAQPQHTRNDSHGGHIMFGTASLYEIYTNNIRNKLTYTGYNSVMFPTARQFWTGNGQGLADFSNSNFVTAGTNFTGSSAAIFPNPNYPSPNGVGAIVRTETITVGGITGEIDFIETPVVDNYRGSASGTNARTSSYSIFNADLTAIGANSAFTLNTLNFDKANEFLIPRAVGYSAGLIDYFFRGKLDVSQDSTIPGTFAIKNMGTENMSGTFSLYYDDASGARNLVFTAPTSLNIPAFGQSNPLIFLPPLAAKSTDKYMLVFQGDMGQEVQTAVAAKTVTLDVPPAVTVTTWVVAPVTMTVGTSQTLQVNVKTATGAAIPCDAKLGCGVGSYGKVQFLDGSTILGVVNVNNGYAGLNWIPTTAGVRTITAKYLGTTPNSPSVATATVSVTTPSIACGEQRSANGKNVVYTSPVIELGTASGNVTFEYDGYSIPDAFEVKTSIGTVILPNTGLISGFHTFVFNPATYSTHQVQVKVTGNADPNTEWTYTMGCPGQTITNADRVKDLVPVLFLFTPNFDFTANGCSFDYYVDGALGAPQKLSQGSHSFHYDNAKCTFSSYLTYPALSGSYYDSVGQHLINVSVWSTNVFTFIVQ